MSSLTFTLICQGGALAIISYFAWAAFSSPLRHVPGPLLAKFTDIWRLFSVLTRRSEKTQRMLHDELGSVVRLGPNMVSVSDPDMISEIFSRKKILTKGDFYKAFDLNVHGQRVEIPFSTRDEHMNSQAWKPVAALYSMQQTVKFEPLLDGTISCFLEELTQRFARTGASCPLDVWLLYCAWDVIGDVTWSKRLGFLEHGKDMFGLLAGNVAQHDYISAIGMMPWLDDWLDRNPVVRIGPPESTPLVDFMLKRIKARTSGKDDRARTTRDMLDGFIASSLPEDKLMGYLYANVAAGGDTAAIELRSIVYFLSKNLSAQQRLREELDTAQLSVPVSWAKCQGLSYLGAVVAEACRLMPAVSLPLERRVSEDGMVVKNGNIPLPPGTTVGVNPYVVHRDKSVFGQDAGVFRPERWLRSPDEPERTFQERHARMKAADLTFGAGKRSCMGRNLAVMEVYKIAASLLCTFDIELVDPKKELHTHNAWLLFQSGLDVKLTKRN